MNLRLPEIILITGAPGSGKTTLRRQLCETNGWLSWPSWTTRLPRLGEVPGFDYIFVTQRQFAMALAQGHLLEHTQLANGLAYGLPRRHVPTRWQPTLVAIVDRLAAPRLAATLPQFSVAIQELTANAIELERRMRFRGDSPEDIMIRLAVGSSGR